MPRYSVFTKPKFGTNSVKFRGTYEGKSAAQVLKRMYGMGALKRTDDVVYAIPDVGRFQYNKVKSKMGVSVGTYRKPK